MITLPHDIESTIAWLHSHSLSTTAGPAAVLSAYRQDLQALLTEAAAGRREYAANAPEASAVVLESEAGTLDGVGRLLDDSTAAMMAWLPSWRWSDEMTGRLR